MYNHFDSPFYKSAMYDSECSQIHPLNYCLGLAQEIIKNKNCKIYEEAAVLSYESNNDVEIKLENNLVIKSKKIFKS